MMTKISSLEKDKKIEDNITKEVRKLFRLKKKYMKLQLKI